MHVLLSKLFGLSWINEWASKDTTPLKFSCQAPEECHSAVQVPKLEPNDCRPFGGSKILRALHAQKRVNSNLQVVKLTRVAPLHDLRLPPGINANNETCQIGINGLSKSTTFWKDVSLPRGILSPTFGINRNKTQSQLNNDNATNFVDLASTPFILDFDTSGSSDSVADEHTTTVCNVSPLRRDSLGGLKPSDKSEDVIPNPCKGLKLDLNSALNEPTEDGVDQLEECFKGIFQRRRDEAALRYGALPTLGKESSCIKETILLHELGEVVGQKRSRPRRASLSNLSSRGSNEVGASLNRDYRPELDLLKHKISTTNGPRRPNAPTIGSNDELCLEMSTSGIEENRPSGWVAESKKPIRHVTAKVSDMGDLSGLGIPYQEVFQAHSSITQLSPPPKPFNPLKSKPANTYPTPPPSRKVTPETDSCLNRSLDDDPTYQIPIYKANSGHHGNCTEEIVVAKSRHDSDIISTQVLKEHSEEPPVYKKVVPEIIPAGTHGMMTRLLLENNRLEGRTAVLETTNDELNRTLEQMDEKNARHMANISAIFNNRYALQTALDKLQDDKKKLEDDKAELEYDKAELKLQVHHLKMHNEGLTMNEEKLRKDRATFHNLYKNQLDKTKMLKDDVNQWKTKYWALAEHNEQVQGEKKRFRTLYESKVSKAKDLKQDLDQWQTKYWTLDDAYKVIERENSMFRSRLERP